MTLNMKSMTRAFLANLIFALGTYAQSVVQVSSVSVRPSSIDCLQQSGAKVQVQVYFEGIAHNKDVQIVVRLSIYSADPPGDTLAIREEDKTIQLRESPGVAEFDIGCSAETRPGKIKVAGAIIRAPAGIKIEEPSNGVATITIKDPER